MDKSKFTTRFEIYDLLPEGMEITSSETEIKNSLSNQVYNNLTYDMNGKRAFESNEEIEEFFKEHTNVVIKKNYNGTGRDKLYVTVDFKERPLYLYGQYMDEQGIFEVRVDYKINYDSIEEFGKQYTNIVYGNTFFNRRHSQSFSFNYRYR